jgi:LacI family transcriptional regulator
MNTRVTIHDVASHAGVSAMTVSRVINDSPRVSDDTRRRVQASIAKLGYVPNRLAHGLIRRKTSAFGVIVPDVANPFFTLAVRGVEQVAWRAGYHVILCDTQGDLERERGYLEDMVAFQVEGVLIARRRPFATASASPDPKQRALRADRPLDRGLRLRSRPG